MLYKFNNKKGNLTVILIGLISVMLLMTLALSKRMTGHTQLLTLGDYTQISRYFLESFVSKVLQQVRKQLNEPNSKLSEEICKNIDSSVDEVPLTDAFLSEYKGSDRIDELANDYGPTNVIEFDYKNDEYFKIRLTDVKLLEYPDWLTIDDELKREKSALLEISCSCKFKKKKYNLLVRFPIKVVYRMTPVLKDFMIFVDNFYEEQKWNPTTNDNYEIDIKDKINILTVKDGLVENTIDEIFKENNFYFNHDSKFRPLVLTADMNLDEKTSGMVYFGPSDNTFEKSIFINLAGISPETDSDDNGNGVSRNYDNGEVHIVTPEALGLPSDVVLTTPVSFNLTGNTWNNSGSMGAGVKAYGSEIKLQVAGFAKFGLFGFCSEILGFFNQSKYPITEFLNDDPDVLMKNGSQTYWGQIVSNNNWEEKIKKYLCFTSGIKVFGLHLKNTESEAPVIPYRQIFGNVFARFLVFTFWNYEIGSPLMYDPDKTLEQAGKRESEIKFLSSNYIDSNQEEEIVRFMPKEFKEGMGKDEQREIYRAYMSKIMSGMYAKGNYKKSNYSRGKNQDLFMPMNFNYSSEMTHEIFDESDFKANDGFGLESGPDFTFNKFGEKWFGAGCNYSSEDLYPIEERIGRSFKDQDEFKEAVGYPEKFKINGIVYVKGELDLSEYDMDLKPEDCSGGIVLVDGKITLGNIYRGEKINSTKFQYYMGSFSGYQDYEKWNRPDDKKFYIGPDKIITFVSLTDQPINIKGNVLLGVQLINLCNKDSNDQVTWQEVDKNKEILFYGSLVCNKLNLMKRLKEFGDIRKPTIDTELNAPFFIYPPVMATSTPPLAVQVMDSMRSYQLTSGAIEE